ncbi:hypothetical protein [Shewanella sp. AC91-MNA-CIBAN-0169]|jgi:hypothetical protein|tara:strand:+ start:154 stop:276 length:123 start_codon:yes stop_codon:yes gene_type:complete
MQAYSSWRALLVAVAALALHGCASSPDEIVDGVSGILSQN